MNTYLTTANYYFQRIRENIPTVVSVYFGIVLTHYVCSNIYPLWCCKLTFFGFIMTPFMIVTPHCEALRWIIHYTGEQIRNVWLWIGGYLVYYVTSTITPYLTNFRANIGPSDTNVVNLETNIEETNDNTEENNIEETIRRRTRSSAHNIVDL